MHEKLFLHYFVPAPIPETVPSVSVSNSSILHTYSLPSSFFLSSSLNLHLREEVKWEGLKSPQPVFPFSIFLPAFSSINVSKVSIMTPYTHNHQQRAALLLLTLTHFHSIPNSTLPPSLRFVLGEDEDEEIGISYNTFPFLPNQTQTKPNQPTQRSNK